MNLDSALSSASSGLDSISRQLAIISQNVSNASTPNYVRQSVPLTSAAAGDQSFGVITGPATRAMDAPLQADLLQAVGASSADQVTQSSLSGIDQASGTPGSGQDLPGLLGALRDSFSTLEADPSNATQQHAVISSAQNLTNGVQALGGVLLKARQSAQDSVVQDVNSANAALHTLGAISNQIIAAKSRGDSTADLENQRDVQMQTLAQLTGARFIAQSNGDMLVLSGGSVLNTRAGTGPFSIGTATLAANTPASAVPGLMLDGAPVGGLGGTMGAQLQLRDTTLPAMQAGLDGFSQSLAASFAGQGLTLFTDPTGTVPTAAAAAGFSTTIQVSTAVQATPTMLRDGAGATVAAGDTTLINNVLASVLSSGSGGLMDQVTNLVAGYSSAASDATSRAATSTAVQTSLQTKLSSETGVSVDGELAQMVTLQNAYGANSKVVAAVQAMYDQLFSSVR